MPAFSGFSEISSISPDTFKMVQDICPPTNRLVAVFLAEDDVGRVILGEAATFTPQIILQCFKELETMTLTKNMFKEFRESFRDQHDSLSKKTRESLDQMAEKAGEVFSGRFDEEMVFKMGDTVHLGIDTETASSITFSQLGQVIVDIDGESTKSVMAITGTTLLVKGKVLFVYVSKNYNDENDIEWTRKTAKEYTEQILSANQTSLPLSIGNIIPVGTKVDPITKELLTGGYTKYNLKSHPKAQGLDITLEYLQSWKAEEGIRPHIVQKFIGQTIGGSAPMCMVIVQKMPIWASLFLEGEVAEDILTESVQEYIPVGGVLTDSGQTKIDGEPCVWLKYYYEAERAGVRVGMYILQYIMFYDDRMLAVQCGVTGIVEDKELFEDAFISNLPIFQMIGNSIVINDKWANPNKTAKYKNSIMEELFGEYWFLTLLFSAILTWGIGLAPPLLIRYAIMRRPMSKKAAIPIVIFFWFVNIVIFTALGSQSKTHAALFLVGLASYYILNRRYATSIDDQSKYITKLATVTSPQEEKITEEPPTNKEPEPIISGRLEMCSNCKRMIGKLEHSYLIEENIVCVKCYQVLNPENN